MITILFFNKNNFINSNNLKNYNKSMAETAKKMKLNNGLEIPIMGLGTT